MAMKIGGILFFVNLIIGLYFLNLGFNLIVLPAAISSVLTTPMYVVGGILLIIGGYFSMRATTPMIRRF
ncbi:MAG: hypothetical protein PHQ66_00945 [Candidatus Nanoarchaeia archaeon]|nr:hypothetical protein [Candidatus Nanoarchaeia archaeon]MDD5358051.1 hypothetical protein [Candidatus Nanoarchaeia archaeon]MDD5588970.1 hypothetical protein [Candidatus Nanoarchaeia archaeon]